MIPTMSSDREGGDVETTPLTYDPGDEDDDDIDVTMYMEVECLLLAISC